MEQFNVISLFDGMSCAMIALQRLGIKPDNYFASEIDKYAIQVSKANWCGIIHIGDVTKVTYFEGVLYTEFGNYTVSFANGLICGGSPCQGFSFAGKQLNFEDPRSKLFFEFVRIYEEIKAEHPDVKVFLENVVMKKEYQAVISEKLELQPVLINSALVSAQNRKRLYWTNIPFQGQPADRGIFIRDILENNCENARGAALRTWPRYPNGELRIKRLEVRKDYKSNALLTGTRTDYLVYGKNIRQINPSKLAAGKQPYMQDRVYHINYKSVAVTKEFGSRLKVGESMEDYRELTVIEGERLQSVPDGYTSCISENQSWSVLGNGWNVDTIVHLFEPLLWIDIL